MELHTEKISFDGITLLLGLEKEKVTNQNGDYRHTPHDKARLERGKAINKNDDYRHKPHEKATKFRRYKLPSV